MRGIIKSAPSEDLFSCGEGGKNLKQSMELVAMSLFTHGDLHHGKQHVPAVT